MSYEDTLHRALGGEDPIIDVAPLPAHAFPDPLGVMGTGFLAAAADEGQQAAAGRTVWLDDESAPVPEGSFGLADVLSGPIDALFMRTGATSAAELTVVDGSDDVDQAGHGTTGDSPEPSLVALLADAQGPGGGFAVLRAEHLSTSLSDLAADAATAFAASTRLLLTSASVATRRWISGTAATTVVALRGTPAVRPDADPPLRLETGEHLVTSGPVRITGSADSVCLIVAREAPNQEDRYSYLIRRATCHPLLRLEVPANPTGEQDIYSLGRRAWLPEVIREIGDVASHSTEAGFDAWYRARLVVTATGTADPNVPLRGRLVGSAGILAVDDEGMLIAAGNRMFAVRHTATEHLKALLLTGPVKLADSIDLARACRALAPWSLVGPTALKGDLS